MRDHAVSQTVRYVLVGGVTAVTYLGLTLLLSGLGTPLLLAVVISYILAVSLHFVLQRSFVFRSASFALPVHDQVRRYVVVGVVQLILTSITTSVLPSALDVSPEAVYVGTVVAMALITFTLLRLHVFHGIEANGST